ncbi:MAG: PadR family transcriptional regulator [Promethearchaeota archaeon]
MGHHRFTSRFLRTISELFILIIISSKREIHPYEVYQELLAQVFHSRQSQIESFSKILQVGKKYLDYLQDPSSSNVEILEKEFNKLLPKGKSIKITTVLDNIQNKMPKDTIINLINEADSQIESEKEDLKIWDSKTAIYQVMNELEREDLIKVTRTEIYKGRGRKLYSITDKGINMVISTIIAFGDLFQKIFPHIELFNEIHQILSRDHRQKLLQFFDLIISSKQIISILNNESEFPLKRLLIEVFPLIASESTLANLINVQKLDLNVLNIEELPDRYRSFYIKNVLKKLHDSKKYIKKKIIEFKDLDI